MIRPRSIATIVTAIACVAIVAGCDQGSRASVSPASADDTAPASSPDGAAGAMEAESANAAKERGERAVDSSPSHLREAIAVLDLRAIELPEATETAHGSPASVTIVAPMSVADAYKFYVSQLSKSGWTESNEAGSRQVADEYAQSIFNKQGYRVSLSVFPADPQAGTVNITLRNHGNLDTRKLPAPAGSKVLFGSQSTTMLVTDMSVAEAVNECRERLRADGWQEFGPAHTQRDENAEQVQLSFCKRGAELSAFVSVAPAQGGKTAIQYNTQLLPGELPWPDNAEQVEFDPQKNFLAYKTESTIAEVVDYYRTHLAPMGWTNRDDLDQLRDEYSALYFDDDQKNRLLVILDRREPAATKVKVEHVSAAVLAALEKADTETSEPQPVEEPLMEHVSIAARSLPIPAQASDVQYDLRSQEIRFSCPESVENIIKFYRERPEMSQWTEDDTFTVITKNAGSMDMQAGPARLSFTLLHIGLNDDTEVRITTNGLSWDDLPMEAAEVDSPESPVVQLVAEDKNGFPVPTSYTGYESQNTNFRKEAIVTIPAPLAAVIEFYRGELPGYEWQEVADEAQIDERSARLAFLGATGRLSFVAEKVGDETRVELATKDEAAARRAGILPEAGKARLIVGNMSDSAASVTVDGRTATLKPGEGKQKPDGPTFDLKPGSHQLSAKVGSGEDLVKELQFGPDETWAILLTEEGVLPLRMY